MLTGEIIPNNTLIIQSRCLWRFFLRTGFQLASDNIHSTATNRVVGGDIVDRSQSLFYLYLRSITVKLVRLGWKKSFEVVEWTRFHLKMGAVLDYYFQAGLDYQFQSRFPNISGDLIQYWGSKAILGSQSESQRTISRKEMSLNIQEFLSPNCALFFLFFLRNLFVNSTYWGIWLLGFRGFVVKISCHQLRAT